jgi:hypothetical protein
MKPVVLAMCLAAFVGVGSANSQAMPAPTPAPAGTRHQLVMLTYLLGDPRAGVGPAHATALGIFRTYTECKKAADETAGRGPGDFAFKSNPGGTGANQLAIAFICVKAP